MSDRARSLAGRRIVVTRRTDQASRLIRLLEERGAVVLKVPATAIGPPEEPALLDEALQGIDRFDWIVFTSANAVEAVRDRLAALGLGLLARGPRVASVGPATTGALGRAFPEDRVDLEPEADYRAAGLLHAFEAHGCSGARVLVPLSSRGREELPLGLRELGAEVTVATAYTTTEPPGLAEAVRRCVDQGFDAATFAAPSAVQAFAKAAGAGAQGLPAVVIGPTTEAAAREALFDILAIASPSTVDGLVAALERALPDSRSRG
jgi:uroporphyrinogen-III synthase